MARFGVMHSGLGFWRQMTVNPDFLLEKPKIVLTGSEGVKKPFFGLMGDNTKTTSRKRHTANFDIYRNEKKANKIQA